jgi:hypothetical protein
MSVTVTSLTHPTMIAKIRAALYYAHKGQGHKMHGHGNRCYIQNAKGRNIMRLNWIGGRQGYIVYGQESKDITATVKAALHRSLHTFDTFPSPQAIALVKSNPSLQERLGKLAALAGMSLAVTGCSSSGAMTAFYSVVGSLFT